MTGLPNLSRLVEQATPGPWTWLHQIGVDGSDVNTVGIEPHPHFGEGWIKGVAGPPIHRNEDAALIAAAPALAKLLIECAKDFAAIADPLNPDVMPVYEIDPKEIARQALARLADYDRSIQ